MITEVDLGLLLLARAISSASGSLRDSAKADLPPGA
jgi:hypothetical protein